jgi:hypothetical protein
MECLDFSFDPASINKPLQLLVGLADNFPLVHFATNVPQFASTLNCPGLAKSVLDTGHSIHNERQFYLAEQIIEFTGGSERASGLLPVWMSPTPLNGPAGEWNRGVDVFVAADLDGDGEDEILIYNNNDLWTGVLKWQDGALVPIWMSPTPLDGPGGEWDRGVDAFVAADFGGGGQDEVVIYNNHDLWTGLVQWNPLVL